jgi:hypothetical protein
MVKFCVGRANNAPLVRKVLKLRWWYSFGEIDDFERCQVIWTSWFKRKFFLELNRTKGVKKIYNRMDKNHYLSQKKCLL